MINTDLVQKYLPQHLWDIANTYSIADNFLETMSDVIVLVLESKSLENQQEKQSWFDLLPLMNTEQVGKLKDILIREKQKLEEIEKKYQQKKDTVINTYVDTFTNPSYQNKIGELKKQETIHSEKDSQDADNLLNTL